MECFLSNFDCGVSFCVILTVCGVSFLSNFDCGVSFLSNFDCLWSVFE